MGKQAKRKAKAGRTGKPLSTWVDVTEDDFNRCLAAYPRQLNRVVNRVFEPAIVEICDRGECVAMYRIESQNFTGACDWRVRRDLLTEGRPTA